MSIAAVTGLIIGSLFVALLTGLPVAFVLFGLSAVFVFIFLGPTVAYTGAMVFFRTMTTDVYIAIPLFTFMAFVLAFSGIAASLYDTMYRWFGGLRGGLAMGTVAICTVLAATTGLGATGVVTMGVIALPEMLKRGYNKDMAVGCIPFGGALGPLIPPSVLMVILGGFTSLSVGKLFMGGVFPGLLMSALAILYIGIKCYRNPAAGPALPPEERASWAEKFKSLRGVIAPIILILLVLGTIYTGVATPSEAGGVGAVGALICAVANRQLSWSKLSKSGLSTVQVTTMVFWLMIGGSFFSTLLTRTGTGTFIGTVLSGTPGGATGALVVMMIIGLILGCFIDGVSITMITIPVFMPVVYQFGLDPLWFILLFTINMVIGYVTPPFGMNLFYMKALVPKDITMADIFRSVLPYCVVMIITLALSIIFPQMLLWLPNAMFK